MPRSIWSGAVSFGLVNVPVKLVTAVSQKEVHFNQLHAEDGARVRYRKVCAADGKELAAEEIVKGYKIGPDRYVTVTEEELEALDPEASRAIEVSEFVDLSDIDPLHYERSYYLVPEQAAVRPYRLLVEAMERSGKVALGKMTMRNKQYLVALRPKEGALVLSTMVYADEIVPLERLDLPEDVPAPADRELKMAEQLIEALSGPFDPSRYHDEQRERVLDLVEKKAAGEEVVVRPPERPKEPVDLMAALEASLQAAKKQKGERREVEAEA